jgi:hypothetical protein
MLLTTHVMVGASLGLLVAPDRPLLAFGVGFLSHILIDIIPHGDADLYENYLNGKQVRRAMAYVGTDAACAVILTLILLNSPLHEAVRGAVSWGIAGGVVPDVLVGAREKLKIQALDGFHRFHFFFHNMVSKRYGDVPMWLGIGGQAAVIAGMVQWFR